MHQASPLVIVLRLGRRAGDAATAGTSATDATSPADMCWPPRLFRRDLSLVIVFPPRRIRLSEGHPPVGSPRRRWVSHNFFKIHMITIPCSICYVSGLSQTLSRT
jgi:hypothetical protein